MSRIVILGCGAVGRHMAIDLCKAPGCEVVSVDAGTRDHHLRAGRKTAAPEREVDGTGSPTAWPEPPAWKDQEDRR